MAKKKASNVVIKDEELIPTTIGTYSNKAKSPVIIFLMLALFLTIAFFLPNIQDSINKFLGKETNDVSNTANNQPDTPNNPDNPDQPNKPDTPDTPKKDDEKHNISSDTIVNLETFTVSNLSISNNLLNLTITAKNEVDLDSYYCELFDENNTFVQRLKISEDTLSSGESKHYSFKLTANPSSISVVKKVISDYPKVNVTYDENGEGKLTCKNADKEEYVYTFVNDNLIKIIYAYSLTDEVDNYSSVLNTYSNINDSYKQLNGLTSSLKIYESSFDYNLIINLSSITDDNYKRVLLDGIFKQGTTPSEVSFKIEAKGYKCSN